MSWSDLYRNQAHQWIVQANVNQHYDDIEKAVRFMDIANVYKELAVEHDEWLRGRK